MDVVLLRQDPPFDLAYITSTHLLETIGGRTLVVNDPAAVRNAPEKLFVMNFPELMPPTLITRDKAAIDAFRAEHGEVVMKPLHGHGGAAVFRLMRAGRQLRLAFRSVRDQLPRAMGGAEIPPRGQPGATSASFWSTAQPAGAVNRVPAENDIRSNMVRGGAAEATELSPREQEICATIGPELKKRGLVFVGIDVIDGFLTEINVTSPTGIRAIQRTGGPDVAVAIWDAIVGKTAALEAARMNVCQDRSRRANIGPAPKWTGPRWSCR